MASLSFAGAQSPLAAAACISGSHQQFPPALRTRSCNITDLLPLPNAVLVCEVEHLSGSLLIFIH